MYYREKSMLRSTHTTVVRGPGRAVLSTCTTRNTATTKKKILEHSVLLRPREREIEGKNPVHPTTLLFLHERTASSAEHDSLGTSTAPACFCIHVACNDTTVCVRVRRGCSLAASPTNQPTHARSSCPDRRGTVAAPGSGGRRP